MMGQPSKITQSSSREPAFDGIRAIAVLLVLVFHANWGIPFLSSGGAAGVDAFFVLSGFLITRILLAEYGQLRRMNLPRFYLRRLVRLWPALATVVCILFVPGLIFFDNDSEFLGSSLAALFYFYPIATSLFDLQFLLYGHTWTLSLEEYFYLVFPPILWIMLRRVKNRTLIASVLFGTSILGMVAVSLVNLYLTPEVGVMGIWGYLRISGIGLGCALAIALENKSYTIVRSSIWGWTAISLLTMSLLTSTSLPFRGLSYLLMDLATLAVIVAIVSKSRGVVHRILGVRPLSFIGQVSYEIYLWHYVLLVLAIEVFGLATGVAAMWVYPATILLAIATHRIWVPFQLRARAKIDAISI